MSIITHSEDGPKFSCKEDAWTWAQTTLDKHARQALEDEAAFWGAVEVFYCDHNRCWFAFVHREQVDGRES